MLVLDFRIPNLVVGSFILATLRLVGFCYSATAAGEIVLWCPPAVRLSSFVFIAMDAKVRPVE